MKVDPDARDLGINGEIENTLHRIMRTNRWTREQAISRVECFLENDPDSKRYTMAPTRPTRPRKIIAEARA